MDNIHIVKISTVAEQFIPVRASNEIDAVNQVTLMRKSKEIPEAAKSDIAEVKYDVVEVLDNELEQAIEYILKKQRNAFYKGED